MSDLPRGRVAFRTIEGSNLYVRCWMGSKPPTVSGGYGGWEEVDRPHRMSVINWRGAKPHRMSIEILFDGWADDDPVEDAISRLERMARDPGGDEAPPRISVVTPGDRPRTPNVEWVINDITWGDALYNRAGVRLRQYATVDLLQYVDDESLIVLRKKKKKKKKHKKGKKGAKKKYTIIKPKSRPGHDVLVDTARPETLRDVASRELGDASRWREIADLNHIRDPKATRVGQAIKLP